MTPVSSRVLNSSLTAAERRFDRKGGRQEQRDLRIAAAKETVILEPSRRLLFQKRSNDMRSEKDIMTSRREFLSNALGIGLVTASSWPIRADQARSMHGQSDSGTSNSGRTTQNISLRWDVFLAPSIPAITSDLPPGEKQRPWPPISSTLISGERDAVLVDIPITGRASARPGELGCGERKESDDDLRHPWPRRSFLWHQYSSGAISRCPLCRAAGCD